MLRRVLYFLLGIFTTAYYFYYDKEALQRKKEYQELIVKEKEGWKF
jgi:hypothetical protein